MKEENEKEIDLGEINYARFDALKAELTKTFLFLRYSNASVDVRSTVDCILRKHLRPWGSAVADLSKSSLGGV